MQYVKKYFAIFTLYFILKTLSINEVTAFILKTSLIFPFPISWHDSLDDAINKCREFLSSEKHYESFAVIFSLKKCNLFYHFVLWNVFNLSRYFIYNDIKQTIIKVNDLKVQ